MDSGGQAMKIIIVYTAHRFCNAQWDNDVSPRKRERKRKKKMQEMAILYCFGSHWAVAVRVNEATC